MNSTKKSSENLAGSAIRHDDLWYDYGSVILHVETTLFRVHRDILSKHSEIFADMFMVPQPEGEPNIDGCPIVHLPDKAADFVGLLKALYDPFYFENLAMDADMTSMLSFLSGILRLSTKYCIRRLRQKSIDLLKQKVPTTFSDLSWRPLPLYRSSPRTSLINLAWESNVPELLPYNFLLCATVDPEKLLGSAQAETLSWKDRTICLIGREKLLRAQRTRVYSFITNFTPSPFCERTPMCKAALDPCRQRNWNTLLFTKVMTFAHFNWDWCIACPDCTAHARAQHDEGRKKLWDLLPDIFQMGSWEAIRREQNM